MKSKLTLLMVALLSICAFAATTWKATEETPVAACYHLTWPDQRIYRGVLKDLAKIVHDNHLTLTTMIVVGEAIDNRNGLSELYNKYFTHLFRKGE